LCEEHPEPELSVLVLVTPEPDLFDSKHGPYHLAECNIFAFTSKTKPLVFSLSLSLAWLSVLSANLVLLEILQVASDHQVIGIFPQSYVCNCM